MMAAATSIPTAYLRRPHTYERFHTSVPKASSYVRQQIYLRHDGGGYVHTYGVLIRTNDSIRPDLRRTYGVLIRRGRQRQHI